MYRKSADVDRIAETLNRRRATPLQLTIVVISALIAYLCSQMRYFADDYCTVSLRRSLGVVGLQKFSYQHWSGRFVSLALTTALQYLPPWSLRYLPCLGFVGLSIGIGAGLRALGTRNPNLLGSAFASALLLTMPTPFQSFFWLTGFLTYSVPLIAACWATSVSARSELLPRSRSVLLTIAALVVGGSSDAVGIVASVLVFGYVLLLLRRYGVAGLRTRVSLAGVVSLWLTTATVVFAPGNRARSSSFVRPSWSTVLRRLPSATIDPLVWVLRNPLSLIFAVAAGALVANELRATSRAVSKGAVLWLLGSATLATVVTETLAIVGTGRSLAPRASSALVHLTLGCVALTVAYLRGTRGVTGTVQRNSLPAVVTLASLLGLSVPLANAVPYARDVARKTDDAYAQIAETKGPKVTIGGAEAVFGLSNIGHTQPVMVMNGTMDSCMAYYFHKSTLSGRSA